MQRGDFAKDIVAAPIATKAAIGRQASPTATYPQPE